MEWVYVGLGFLCLFIVPIYRGVVENGKFSDLRLDEIEKKIDFLIEGYEKRGHHLNDIQHRVEMCEYILRHEFEDDFKPEDHGWGPKA